MIKTALAFMIMPILLLMVPTSVLGQEVGVESEIEAEVEVGSQQESESSTAESKGEVKVKESEKEDAKESEKSSQNEAKSESESDVGVSVGDVSVSTRGEGATNIGIKPNYPMPDVSAKNTLSLQTNQHLYKPGDRVKIQGSLWTELLATLGDSNFVTVTVMDKQKNVIHEGQTQISAKGDYSTEFKFPANSQKGAYTISSTIELNAEALDLLDVKTQTKIKSSTKIVVVPQAVFKIDVKDHGQFDVRVASNSTVKEVKFSGEQKKVSVIVEGKSGTKGVSQVEIPKGLVSGKMAVMIDGKIAADDQVIVTQNTETKTALEINYNHSVRTIDIAGTNTVEAQEAGEEMKEATQEVGSEVTEAAEEIGSTGGCLIATATFDSEMASQVQFLREIRDETVLNTASGTAFMSGFNQIYYSFSPTIADWERQNPVFKEFVKITITPMISSLSILEHADPNSELSVLSFGLSIIGINLGMYVAIPTAIIWQIKKRL